MKKYTRHFAFFRRNFICLAMTFGSSLGTTTFAHNWTLEEKIGQMFILGFPNADFETVIAPQIVHIKPGAIIWFRRNIHSFSRIHQLNTKVQNIAFRNDLPQTLIMLDQEGGVVSRLPSPTPFASALSLGRLKDKLIVEEYGKQTGLLLRTLGFNTNLAPVLDISPPGEENFLGHRAFGGQPEEVITTSSAFTHGLLAAGIIPVAKHFPGHGGVIEDSHKVLPRKNLSLEQLSDHDLKPFAHFAAEFPLSGLMAAHLAFPSIDASGVPASFSQVISTDLLRKKLQFSGILITDDLEMASAQEFGDVGERAVKAIEAGADMIMLSWNQKHQKTAFSAVLAAVSSGRLKEARINDSVERIQKIKIDLAKKPPLSEDMGNSSSVIARINDLNGKIARFHFDATLPTLFHKLSTAEFSKVAVFSSDSRFSRSALKHIGRAQGLPTVSLHLGKFSNERAVLKNAFSKGMLGLFYVTGHGSARLLRSLPKSICSRMIVINTMYPGLIDTESSYLGVINLYSRYPDSGAWISDLIQKAHSHPLVERTDPNSKRAEIH